MAQRKRTLEKIAEEFMPGWKAVPKVAPDDAANDLVADATIPSVAQLKQKYFGNAPAADAGVGGDVLSPLSGLMPMAPVREHDAPAGQKVLVFHEGKVTGSQG
jgi:hypothetical protein